MSEHCELTSTHTLEYICTLRLSYTNPYTNINTSMAPIRVAVIGYGLSAKIFHIPFILALPELYTLHGVLQRTPNEKSNPDTDHEGVKVYRDLDTLLADSEVELVVITSIPTAHYEQCEAILKKGKHVLCEKPFVPSSAEAMALGKIAQESGRVLAVYQNRRWDADFVTLRDILAKDRLGRVVEFESHFDRHRPNASTVAQNWKAQPNQPAGGAIYDLGSHLLDQIVTLFGPPKTVTAFVGNQRAYGDHSAAQAGGDSFTVLLHYSSGLLCTAKAAVVSAGNKQLRFWVRGEKGSFQKMNLDVQEPQLIAGKRPGKDADFGVEDEGLNGLLTLWDEKTGKMEEQKVKPKVPTYTGIYKELAAAIKGEGEVPVTAEQAATVLRVIELAKESSESGKTVNF